MNYYKAVLKKYAEFKGRARRAEYWYFVLFNAIFTIVAAILDKVIDPGVKIAGFYGIIYALYTLAVIIPSLAVVVRRLHDTGKSGWMILVGLIPLAGAIWLLVLMIIKGDVGENKYGPDPKILSEVPVQSTPAQS
jgi:uncharacterized membrane protein YhaH (DUF805 family)